MFRDITVKLLSKMYNGFKFIVMLHRVFNYFGLNLILFCKILASLNFRPFERTITLQKDSTGHVGFIFKDGRVTSLVKDSSAAR